MKSTQIGAGTRVWQFCVIFAAARIGENCNVCSHVLIEDEVVIGNNVTIKSGVQVWNGVELEDHVFIGPNVTFTNDIVPRSNNTAFTTSRTLVQKGASIGANSTVVAGNVIGAYALVGAGSVVTHSIPAYHLYYGNPARHRGYVTKEGVLLDMDKKDAEGREYKMLNGEIISA